MRSIFNKTELAEEKEINLQLKREATRKKVQELLTIIEEKQHFLSEVRRSCPHVEEINNVCIDCLEELNG